VNPPAQPGTLQRRPRSATIGTGRFTNADPAQDEQIDQGTRKRPGDAVSALRTLDEDDLRRDLRRVLGQ